MSSLEVRPVRTSTEQKKFLQLPWDLYRGDPNWVPPLRQNQAELVGFRHHPFYDENPGQAFLAMQNGKAVGRIMAIAHRPFMKRHKENRGYFGFFESVNDAAVSRGLFSAAEAWLAERDILAMRGPINPSLNYECGLLVEGFDKPPTFMMTYNHAYYAQLVEEYGFKKTQDMYAFWGHVDMLTGLDKKLEFVVKECTRRFDVKLRRINTRKFFDDVRMFLNIYNQSLVGTWGFAPMSEKEMEHAAAGLKHLIVPEMTTIAEVDGKAVGVVFGLLDYNPRIKLIDGRLFPFGFLRLLWNRRAIKKVRLISTNVVPEYQRWGLGVVLLSRLVPDILAWGIQEAEFSWVLESNHLSYASLKRGGAVLEKTYRLYDYGEPTPYVETEESFTKQM
jgi:GNAT superfamily N-acetyltransferase